MNKYNCIDEILIFIFITSFKKNETRFSQMTKAIVGTQTFIVRNTKASADVCTSIIALVI